MRLSNLLVRLADSVRVRRRLVRLAMVPLALSVLAAVAVAQERAVPLETRARGAERVIVGRVASVDAAWQVNDFGDRLIVSAVRVTVDETLKGQTQQTVDVEVEGGTIGDLTLQRFGFDDLQARREGGLLLDAKPPRHAGAVHARTGAAEARRSEPRRRQQHDSRSDPRRRKAGRASQSTEINCDEANMVCLRSDGCARDRVVHGLARLHDQWRTLDRDARALRRQHGESGSADQRNRSGPPGWR